ncbi:MAG: UDP-N-acetylmuramate--L-alanine ligase [Candidatus Paceibacteria bacterium]
MKQNKHIHFIGVCGVAMSALALAFHKNGWKVTGSDKGFYPPVSTKLKNSDIFFYPGWHPDKMTKNGDPDLIVVGNVAGSNNPEWSYAKENNIEFVSYPELVSDHLICDQSIVSAGSYGKTTTSTLLAWILKENNIPANYLYGGISQHEDFPAANIDDNADWSITEGDEYKTARWDESPKFKYYDPTHLLLTSIEWDHADIYPTESDYLDTFESLIKSIPDGGYRLISQQVFSRMKDRLDFKPTTYGKQAGNDFYYSDFQQTKSGISFAIHHQGSKFQITNTNLLGEYMAENITACFAMALQVGLEPIQIISSISSFRGIKRRLQRRYKGDVDVYDDIAHSPQKAKSVLETLDKTYQNKIIAVFEPNTGNRKQKAIPSYKNAFDKADEVVIPRLSKVKKKKDDPDPPFDGEKLKEVIEKSHTNVKYIDDDFDLVDHLNQTSSRGDVILFLGSHGFRKMIEMTVDAIS